MSPGERESEVDERIIMPNGYQGSKKKWDRMEAPLKELDPILQEFAARYYLEIEWNYHNWPSRSLKWEHSNIKRLIQIYLENEKRLTFNVWMCASKDIEGKRYWKNAFLKKDCSISEIKTELRELLEQARNRANSWQGDDLEFATYLAGTEEFEKMQRKNKQSFMVTAILFLGAVAIAIFLIWKLVSTSILR